MKNIPIIISLTKYTSIHLETNIRTIYWPTRAVSLRLMSTSNQFSINFSFIISNDDPHHETNPQNRRTHTKPNLGILASVMKHKPSVVIVQLHNDELFWWRFWKNLKLITILWISYMKYLAFCKHIQWHSYRNGSQYDSLLWIYIYHVSSCSNSPCGLHSGWKHPLFKKTIHMETLLLNFG